MFIILAACITAALLFPLQIMLDWDMLLLERFLEHGGYIQIAIFSFYAGFIYHKLSQAHSYVLWRKRIWLVFSIVFFAQLILGIAIDSIFLLTGKLHFPIPAMILAGSAYRLQVGFMPILFVSTLILSGPAWCSFLCYFGAADFAASGVKKTSKKSIKNKTLLKWIILAIVVAIALLLRVLGTHRDIVNALVLSFGVLGILVILFFSTRNGKMVHCSVYCPIGTLVSIGKYLSPFRFRINNNCTNCMKCIKSCKYDALNPHNIKSKKIGITCTYCGDCTSSCPHDALGYKLFGLSHEQSRRIFLLTVVVLHAVFLSVARI